MFEFRIREVYGAIKQTKPKPDTTAPDYVAPDIDSPDHPDNPEYIDPCKGIDWAGLSEGRIRTIDPDFGDSKTKGSPTLVYRLISPDIIDEAGGTVIRPRMEVEYTSEDEKEYITDLTALTVALQPLGITGFTPTAERIEDSKIIYGVVISLA